MKGIEKARKKYIRKINIKRKKNQNGRKGSIKWRSETENTTMKASKWQMGKWNCNEYHYFNLFLISMGIVKFNIISRDSASVFFFDDDVHQSEEENGGQVSLICETWLVKATNCCKLQLFRHFAFCSYWSLF